MDYRRIFVSNPKIAGHRLRDLNLPQQFGAVVTRVRRGDVELLPHGDTVLELGDRVRVLTQRERMDAVSAFFGDSYRALSEIDILTFSLGLALGLLLGVIPIPLPGGVTLKLGFAGGPLIVALILGSARAHRPDGMEPAVQRQPDPAADRPDLVSGGRGHALRLCFRHHASPRAAACRFLSPGAVITCATALATLWIGHKLLKIPMGLLGGMLAGLQTQPAVLGFALEQTDNELPNIGYATVYPIAMIAKILMAQLLLTGLL